VSDLYLEDCVFRLMRESRIRVSAKGQVAVEDGSGMGDAASGLPKGVDVRNFAGVHFDVLQSGKTRAERYTPTMNKSRTTSDI
jgi:hypothetical protein